MHSGNMGVKQNDFTLITEAVHYSLSQIKRYKYQTPAQTVPVTSVIVK